ncbi:MAG: hypothetical protein FJ190_04290 [Gammaproteobacteria bacterium]|nr:hypothetical protein [Gammaproteobacteria bacterium]
MKTINRRITVALAAAWNLSSCSVNPVISNLPLDLSRPGSIEIVIASGGAKIDVEAIKTETGKNLSDWRYPITPAYKEAISHQMTVEIGKTERGSTPAGFSFSIGNSDPRALDFQKANVLPITCKLNSIQNGAQSAELSMGFIDSAVTSAHPDSKEISDHVSTVCFNLLKEINWPVDKSTSVTTSSSLRWIPEIRIETEEESSISGGTTTTQTASQPNSKNSKSSSNSQFATGQSQTENNEVKPKTLTKEITKEGRKVYIIHNQGNPIIFKFGHDRK